MRAPRAIAVLVLLLTYFLLTLLGVTVTLSKTVILERLKIENYQVFVAIAGGCSKYFHKLVQSISNTGMENMNSSVEQDHKCVIILLYRDAFKVPSL